MAPMLMDVNAHSGVLSRTKKAERNLARLRIYRRSTIFAALIDSGNLSVPLMSNDFFENYVKSSSNKSYVLKLSVIRLVAPNQTTIHHLGMLESFPFVFENCPQVFHVDCLVVEGLTYPLNLGIKFLSQYSLQMNFGPENNLVYCLLYTSDAADE